MFRGKILISVFWVIFTLTASTASPQPPLTIAYPPFAPFHSKSADGSITGFFYDIITVAVEHRMGIPLAWDAYPWPRCQANVAAGRRDAILTVPTSERAAYSVTHETPFFIKKLNVFTAADHKRLKEILAIKEIADIKKGGFSVVTYSGNGWHQENVAALGVQTFETSILKSVWRMLAAGRGDIVIEWPRSAWPDIRLLGLSGEIIQTPVVLSVMPFHMLIGKNSPYKGILPELDVTIRAMQADGTIDRILAKYD